MTWAWFAASALVFAGLCAVPFALSLQLLTIERQWAGRLGEGLPMRLRIVYRLTQARAVGSAMLMGAIGASYLWLVAVHCGLLTR